MPDNIDVSKFSTCWYGSFVKILIENLKRSEISKIFDNIEIINFNYDRCLEQFLPLSLASYYGVQPDQFRNLMANLRMHRPYGSVGKLPWQAGDAPSVPFGGAAPQHIAAVASQIRTFSETVEEGAELQAIRNAIATADRIVFLGFAFHRQNVRLIAQQVQEHTEILATAYQISESDKGVIDSELSAAFEFGGILNEGRIELADMTCEGLFKAYWRTLTAEKSERENTELPGLPSSSLPSWSMAG